MLKHNGKDNDSQNSDDENQQLFTSFKNDLAVILKESISAIAKCFDECLTNISDVSTSNRALYRYKMKEVDGVFDTIVTAFYKNKLLSVIPDIMFTLESTRLSKAAIISQNYLVTKHRSNLKKGLDAFRRNVSRFYILQDKNIEKTRNKERACNMMIRYTSRKLRGKMLSMVCRWKDFVRKEFEIDRSNTFDKDKQESLTTIEQLQKQIVNKDQIMRMTQKGYTIISKFANTSSDETTEELYQNVVLDICKIFFPSEKKFYLKYENITSSDLTEEDLLDFKWCSDSSHTILNLNKPSPKTHQYRLYFPELPLNSTSGYKDAVQALKLLINMLAWVRTLVSVNSMLVEEEITPLRQD